MLFAISNSQFLENAEGTERDNGSVVVAALEPFSVCSVSSVA